MKIYNAYMNTCSQWYEKDNLLQLSGSLYAYFGFDRGHGSDPYTDRFLQEHHPRTVIAVLIDALGSSIIDEHTRSDGFFQRCRRRDLTTVFPPTTTAATTAFLTGHSPAENGWLAWCQYFAEEDDHIVLLMNRSRYGEKKYPDSFTQTKLPAKPIYEYLNENGIPAESVWPHWSKHNPSASFAELLENAAECAKDNRFVYAYWDELDSFLHVHGVHGEDVCREVQKLDAETERFAASLPEDTVLLVMADHSQVEVTNYNLAEDTQLCDCLRMPPSFEPRTMTFMLKDGMEDTFRRLFKERFGDAFLLLSKDELLSSGLFGPGTPSLRLSEFIGDLTAIALTPLELDYRMSYRHRGNHAGMMKEERMIPLILYTKK